MGRIATHDDWRRDIWIGAGRCDAQNDFMWESRDCVVGSADHLDDDSRLAGGGRGVDRADALDRRYLGAEQRSRKNRHVRACEIDPELVAVGAELDAGTPGAAAAWQ